MMLAAVVLGMASFGLVACGMNGRPAEGPAGDAEADVGDLPPTAHAMVLKSEQLHLLEGRSVLEALQADVPSLHIAQSSDCPSLSLRGPNPTPGLIEPTVYVDGAAASNTCVLEDLSTDQLARVEVYPSGFTPRPGYAPNARGLILLFTRRAAGDTDAGRGVRH
jgi:hypothetical protein